MQKTDAQDVICQTELRREEEKSGTKPHDTNGTNDYNPNSQYFEKANGNVTFPVSICPTVTKFFGNKFMLSVEHSASCGTLFGVNKRKLLDRECFITSLLKVAVFPCAEKAAIPCGSAAAKPF